MQMFTFQVHNVKDNVLLPKPIIRKDVQQVY